MMHDIEERKAKALENINTKLLWIFIVLCVIAGALIAS
tara:strand:+ start:930 stop:1043 length:114 start_codon:yes stop_codon:yes gene_type:complete